MGFECGTKSEVGGTIGKGSELCLGVMTNERSLFAWDGFEVLNCNKK